MLTAIIVVFVLGYAAIAFEHKLNINKAAAAVLTGILCWVLLVFANDPSIISLVDRLMGTSLLAELQAHPGNEGIWMGYINHELGHHLSEIAQIVFFLMGAMTIVELVDVHGGFSVITDRIRTHNKVKLLWIIALISFFLSAVLDNLTTSIVMVSLVNKLVEGRNSRWMLSGIVIIAANAGGAWSPIGDVTTTMLWIEDQVTTQRLIMELFIPSLVSLVVPLIILSFFMKGEEKPHTRGSHHHDQTTQSERLIVLIIGLGGLLFVPVFKVVTHLPPYMGILLSLGILWVVTEYMHRGKEIRVKKDFSPAAALERIDIPSILFFLGILLAVAALQSSGHLPTLAQMLKDHDVDQRLTVTGIGLLSAIVDNVPLVKATQGMYPITAIPTDASFWHGLAYCAGTGGSILIIGSAAGVAVMGIQKIDFFWYLKKISLLALVGYIAGMGTYLALFHWH